MPIENSTPFTVLLVDDDEDVLTAYRHLLQLSGYSAKGTHSPTKALALLNEHWNGVVVSDIYMPAMNGMDLLNEVKKIDPEIPVIMITGHGDIPLAVEAVKRGAFDFLEKPLDSAQFLQLLKRAQQIRQGIIEQREAISSTFKEHLFGTSEQINQIRQQLRPDCQNR
ncbi:sigma-54-dependent Fis family transcriptional regulator [Shewanella sp. GD03713]|uniref:sigma-54-dependent Fis family transcriptional regulator n=1 Tax=Shewanella sp. GD03713 TaxID=2975372 RepID=UPI002114B69D|nr:sigma-54-dependent Fis family transcriptional regulator [Shewanella sp. GD03713]MDH1471145.1 sigma-54-dependent Fis family transcriptional regulator [Shewanella sp. GD03713]